MNSFFEHRQVDPARIMATALGKLSLPTFPGATMSALELLRDPTSCSRKVAQAIEVNPGLVTHLLRIVNSAAYGLRQRVERVSHAIALLGRAQVEALVVASAVKGSLSKATPKTAGKRFWQGAAVRATLAREVAAVVDPPSQSEAFVGGLLQDMALPLLFSSQGAAYRPLVMACAEDPTKQLDALERETFGWDHSVVGACIAQHWSLPQNLMNGIGYHHEESLASAANHLVSHVRDNKAGPDASALPEIGRCKYGVPETAMNGAIERAGVLASELVQLLA